MPRMCALDYICNLGTSGHMCLGHIQLHVARNTNTSCLHNLWEKDAELRQEYKETVGIFKLHEPSLGIATQTGALGEPQGAWARHRQRPPCLDNSILPFVMEILTYSAHCSVPGTLLLSLVLNVSIPICLSILVY